MSDAAHNPGRLLAPLALVVCAIAFFAVLLSSDAGNDGDSAGSETTAPAAGTQGRTTTERSRPLRRTYTVQPNDSLDAIAQRFGLEVERLQELNPEVDPQGLVVGQKIKLRE
jgi:LysM repeat protein